MIINNPYLYHPQPLCREAAGDLCKIIDQHPDWETELSKGKMLGVLLVKGDASETSSTHVHYLNKEYSYIAAYSGIIGNNQESFVTDPATFFVPPIYDLSKPDDFYKSEESNISKINQRIKALEANAAANKPQIAQLKKERKERSQQLQIEIFKHFNIINYKGETKNIIDIFADARRGLPPGGAGECAAPRLLQYAFSNGLHPVAMSEFWYGISPRLEIRLHKNYYPSCIEKCSPILAYQLGAKTTEENDLSISSTSSASIIYDDADIVVVNKPAELLSTPAKDLTLPNVETWLHEQYPEIKGPMLVHRLDQSTSGLMIAAKNAATFKLLQQGFLDHSIRKTYIAWIEGNLASDSGVINLAICPNPDDRPHQTVDNQFGKLSITRYHVVKREGDRTLLELHPFTGRTHQLRLHCASPFGLDHPIVGDRLYTTYPYETANCRLMLHAQRIEFTHPSNGRTISFETTESF